MSGRYVAMRYARALYEAAFEAGAVEEAAADLEVIERLFTEAPEIRRYCLEPRKNGPAEAAFVETAFLPYVGNLTSSLVRLTVKLNRMAALPFLPEAYRRIREERADVVKVELETSREPDPELLGLVERKMAERIGGKIILSWRVLPELLGGLRILWRNRSVDLSAAGRIRHLRSRLRTL